MATAGVWLTGAPTVLAGWIPADGTNEFTSAANWSGGVADGVFDEAGGAYNTSQLVTLNVDTVLTAGLTFDYDGAGSFQVGVSAIDVPTVSWDGATDRFSGLTLGTSDPVHFTASSPVPNVNTFTGNGGWQATFYARDVSGNTFKLAILPGGGAIGFGDVSAAPMFRSRVITLGGDIVFRAANAAAQTLTIGAGGGSTNAISLKLTGDRMIDVSAGDTVILRNEIFQDGTNRKLIKAGAGTLQLGLGLRYHTLNSVFVGGIDLNAGVLRIGGGSSSGLTVGALGKGSIRCNGGGLEYTVSEHIGNPLVLGADLPIAIVQSGVSGFRSEVNGAISGSGDILIDVSGSNGHGTENVLQFRAANSYAGNLFVTNRSSATTVPFRVELYSASGTVTLPGDVTLAGSSALNGSAGLKLYAGRNEQIANASTVTLEAYSFLVLPAATSETIATLVVNDSHGANVTLDATARLGLGTPAAVDGKLSLRNGGTLAGRGVVDAAVVADEVGGTVVAGATAAGAAGPIGCLTISGGLTTAAPTTFAFNFDSTAHTNGWLALTGATDSLTPAAGTHTVTLHDVGADRVRNGTYTLIAGMETGAVGDFALGALPDGWSGSLSVDAGRLLVNLGVLGTGTCVVVR